MSDNLKIIEFLNSSCISFSENIDLKNKTWINTGGIAQIWVQPDKLSNLETLISWCQLNYIDFEIIGNTSNCYFLNSYNPVLVISTLKLNNRKVEGNTVTCECGHNMVRLAKFCISNGIAGYEGFVGLPGTVGGAAVNNSGCYGSLISNLVKEVTIIENGKQKKLTNKQMEYQNRSSILKRKKINAVVLSIKFDISEKGGIEYLQNTANNFQQHRKRHQEHKFPNLGTTFCELKLKRLALIKNILLKTINKSNNLLIKNSITKQKLRTKYLLAFYNAGSFKKYVSEYGIQCFTWKDKNAEEAFNEYVKFINRITNKAVLEIEIKK